MTREWVGVRQSPSGTVVTVAVQDGHLSAKWAVKTYRGQIRRSVVEARKAAYAALEEVRQALADQG